MKWSLVYIFLLVTDCFFAQDAIEVLQKVISVNKKETTRKFDLVYTLYRSENPSNPVSTYSGSVVQKGNLLYQKINNSIVFQNSDLALSIDVDEKIIQLINPSNVLNNQDLEILQKECDSILLEKFDNHFELTLLLSNISQLPFQKVVLNIDSNNYRIVKNLFYYSVLQDFSKEFNQSDFAYPILSISVQNYDLDISNLKDLLELNNYILKSENQYFAGKEFLDYTIIDKR